MKFYPGCPIQSMKFNLIPNNVNSKSFLTGMAIASVCWLTALVSMSYVTDDKPVTCDELIIKERVKSYEHGYFTGLKDADPNMYNAYLQGYTLTYGIEEQEVIDSIVFDLAAKYNLNDDKREYLYTLITD